MTLFNVGLKAPNSCEAAYENERKEVVKLFIHTREKSKQNGLVVNENITKDSKNCLLSAIIISITPFKQT